MNPREVIFEGQSEEILVYGFVSKIQAIKWLRYVTKATKGYTIGLREAKALFDDLETANRPIVIMAVESKLIPLITMAGHYAGLVFEAPLTPEPNRVW